MTISVINESNIILDGVPVSLKLAYLDLWAF